MINLHAGSFFLCFFVLSADFSKYFFKIFFQEHFARFQIRADILSPNCLQRLSEDDKSLLAMKELKHSSIAFFF